MLIKQVNCYYEELFVYVGKKMLRFIFSFLERFIGILFFLRVGIVNTSNCKEYYYDMSMPSKSVLVLK